MMTAKPLSHSLLLALVCTAAAPLAAMAQSSSQQPQASQGEQQRSGERIRVRDGDGRDLRQPGQGPGPGGDRGPGGPGPGPGGGPGPMADQRPGPFDAPTAEEWDKCEAFSKEFGPKRWAILQTLDEDRQQYIRGMIFWRYRNLERIRNSDPDMYQIHLKRFGIEDEIFGIRFPISQELRAATSEETSRLKEKAAAWIDAGLEERELRIQRLRDMLKREEDYLASEKNSREAAIAERLALIEQGRGLGMRRRRDGEGGVFPPPPPLPRPETQQAPSTQPAPQR